MLNNNNNNNNLYYNRWQTKCHILMIQQWHQSDYITKTMLFGHWGWCGLSLFLCRHLLCNFHNSPVNSLLCMLIQTAISAHHAGLFSAQTVHAKQLAVNLYVLCMDSPRPSHPRGMWYTMGSFVCHHLFGHVARLADDIPANQILRICCKVQEGDRPSPGWRRARGRPPTTWIYQIGRDTGIPALA